MKGPSLEDWALINGLAAQATEGICRGANNKSHISTLAAVTCLAAMVASNEVGGCEIRQSIHRALDETVDAMVNTLNGLEVKVVVH